MQYVKSVSGRNLSSHRNFYWVCDVKTNGSETDLAQFCLKKMILHENNTPALHYSHENVTAYTEGELGKQTKLA